MADKFTTCVFFSTQYPYETTLKNEFGVMSERFERVFYFPKSIKDGKKPKLPDNIILVDFSTVYDRNWKKSLFLYFFSVCFLFLEEAVKNEIKVYLKSWKTYLSIAAKNYYLYLSLKKFIKKEQIDDALFYDYWFENSTIAIALLKKRGIIKKAVSRAHGFDLYDERWKEGLVPYRNLKLKHLDGIFCVANHGYQFLLKKTTEKDKKKIGLYHLGVTQAENVIKKEKNEIPVIVSISNTQEFKRVHLIPDILKQIPFPISWVHFGSGPKDQEIIEQIKQLPAHIKAEFMGNVANEEIHSFYYNQKIDLFLSLSMSEGLPISMMEAISYGVPVFACNVCGIPDLVNEETGALFDPKDGIEVIVEKLTETIKKEFNSEAILNFSRENFDYRKNYQDFFDEIIKK